MSHLAPLQARNRIIIGSGPIDAHTCILKALATPLIGHLDPQFGDIMDDIIW